MSAERLAIQLMVAQGFLFACETALIHHIGSGISVMQLALVRGLGGLVLAVLVAGKLGFSALETHQLPLQLLRGAVTLLYLWVLIFSFSRLPFADATAISYTQAAYIAIFSVLILGERVTRSRWAAVAVGIGGALLIAKPAFASWNIAYLVAVAGTSLNGLAFVLNRYLQRRDSETTTMFYTSAVLVLGNAPVLLTTTGLPTSGAVAWLPMLMLLGPLGLYLGIVAVKHASAAMLAPYTLVRLLIGVIGGVLLFGEMPDLYSVLGVVLIVGSCVLSSWTGVGGRAKTHALQTVPA
jgi:drug/metabolite transporter (DMT)-like permease